MLRSVSQHFRAFTDTLGESMRHQCDTKLSILLPTKRMLAKVERLPRWKTVDAFQPAY